MSTIPLSVRRGYHEYNSSVGKTGVSWVPFLCKSICCLYIRKPSAQVHFWDHRCPSSARRRELFTFSTSPLKPLNGIHQNLTGNVLYQVCGVFFGGGGGSKKDGRPGLWLAETFSTILWNRWTEFNETWQGERSQCPLSSLCFGPIGKTRWPPWPLISWDIFDFSSERNSTKRDRKQDLNALYHVCVFRANGKNKMATLASVGWKKFDFSSKTAYRNSMKLDRKQDLNVLYQVCVFWPIGKTRWPPDLWLVETFWLLLWNRWTEFNETWQESKSQRPLPSCCFRADQKNKMATPAPDLLRHFRLLWNCLMEFNETWQEARS